MQVNPELLFSNLDPMPTTISYRAYLNQGPPSRLSSITVMRKTAAIWLGRKLSDNLCWMRLIRGVCGGEGTETGVGYLV